MCFNRILTMGSGLVVALGALFLLPERASAQWGYALAPRVGVGPDYGVQYGVYGWIPYRRYYRNYYRGRGPRYRYRQRRYRYRPQYYRRYQRNLDFGSGERATQRDSDIAESSEQRRTDGTASPPPPTTLDPGVNAWRLLADGKHERAHNRFRELAHEYPDRASPKVGYALAAAGLGRYEQCAQAMRRAFGHAPEGLEQLGLDKGGLDEALQPLVSETRQWYQERLDADDTEFDAAFMVAALHYLGGDLKAARPLVERAAEQGEPNLAEQNLRYLLAAAREAGEEGAGEEQAASPSAGYSETPPPVPNDSL